MNSLTDDASGFSPTVQPPFKHFSGDNLSRTEPLPPRHIPWELVPLVLASAGGIEESRYFLSLLGTSKTDSSPLRA